MRDGRHILTCLLMLVLTSGPAVAGMDVAVASDSLSLDAPTSWPFVRATRWCLPESDLDPCESAGERFAAASSTALGSQDMEQAKLDDESLSRVCGGAASFAAPDVINQGLFAVILWDEGKRRRSSTFAWNNGQVNSTILVQRR